MQQRPQIPPELLMGMPTPGATTPVPGATTPVPGSRLPAGFVDGPSEDPMLRSLAPRVDGGYDPMSSPPQLDPSLQSPLAPGMAEPAQIPGAAQGQDPVLYQLLQQAATEGPRAPKERKPTTKKPDPGDIMAVAERDRLRHAEVVARMSRDVALFRQHESATPKSFKADRETAVKSAELSTLVVKLSNMFARADQIIEVPYDTMDEEKSAQIIEDALYQLRKLAKRTYGRATAGGSLQRDEFFYMFLHGRYVKRILPDLHDRRYPYHETLLDPATCFPFFGNGKEGMLRMTRKYTCTVGDVITDYGSAVPDLQKKLAKKLGYDDLTMAKEFLDIEGECMEYWDKDWRYVTFKGEEVMPVTFHGIGQVPFVYVMPVGEPRSMSTPGGRYWIYDRDVDANIPYMMGTEQDMAEKGVSVYHYLINTHRLTEMLMTILYNEVEKAGDPATITYTAPHLGGQEPPPLDTKRGGNNTRQLNFQQVEAIPTSPRPTDMSPLMQKVGQEFIEGSFPPGMFGADQSANITGRGTDAQMQNAMDLVTPYIEGWENGQAQEHELKLNMYVDIISPIITIAAPAHDPRGEGKGEINDLSPMDVESVGTFVEVNLVGLSMQNESAQIAAMNQAIQAGLYSQRHAMSKLNVRNPDKMFAEILAEKAFQHPEMMENFMIPEAFESQGMSGMAQLWMDLVVMPKMMQMFGGMSGPGGMGGPPEAAEPGEAPGGVGSQAVPNPLQGVTPQSPGGPPPGMGRSPSQG